MQHKCTSTHQFVKQKAQDAMMQLVTVGRSCLSAMLATVVLDANSVCGYRDSHYRCKRVIGIAILITDFLRVINRMENAENAVSSQCSQV